MNKFETSDFDRLVQYIQPILEEGYQLRIVPDCENVFMVDFVNPEFGEGSFELVADECLSNGDVITRVDGRIVEYVSDSSAKV